MYFPKIMYIDLESIITYTKQQDYWSDNASPTEYHKI
jgi:hypothetical protein